MNESYLKLTPDGRLSFVRVEESERCLNSTMLTTIGRNVARVTRNVTQVDEQPFGIVATHSELHGFLELNGLHLRTHFRLGLDGLLRPYHVSRSDPYGQSEQGVSFAPFWIKPSSMKLVFSARILDPGTDSMRTSHNKTCQLMAFSERKCYRLPLPNLYENCDLCMGEFGGHGDSVLGAFMQAYNQFKNSSWNSDLSSSERMGSSDRLFRFIATSDQFVQDTSGEFFHDWTQCCAKAGTSLSGIIGGAL